MINLCICKHIYDINLTQPTNLLKAHIFFSSSPYDFNNSETIIMFITKKKKKHYQQQHSLFFYEIYKPM